METQINEEPAGVYTDMDRVYEIVEKRGCYKYLVLIGATLAFLSHMFFLFSFPFFLIRPKAFCDISGSWTECTQDEICDNLDNEVSYYFDKPKEYNFVTEFDWYCDMTMSSFSTGPAFFAGTTISVLIVTALSDTIGRLPMLVIGVAGNFVSIALFMLFASPITCLITSFSVGFFTMANNSSSFNFLADSVPEKYRETFPSFMNTGWALGEIVIALIMWSDVHWRVMCFVMILFSAAFFIPVVWLRESPKFYFSQNKIFKAQTRLKNMASVNGSSAGNIRLAVSSTETGKESIGFKKRISLMCCNRSTLMQIILITTLFSIGNMVFYAMSLNIENMGGNPYIMGIALAVAEISAYVLCLIGLKFIGPKICIAASFLVTDVGLLGLIFYWTDPVKSIVFAFIGKLGSAAVDNLLYTLSGLVFPTEILGGALGIALLGTRAGNSASKPMILLGPEVMCGFMLVLGVVAVVLPIFVKVKSPDKKDEKTINETEGLADKFETKE